MIIRLSHNWSYHKTRDVLETPDDLTVAEARRLIHAGVARDVEDIVTDNGGGWYEVPLRAGGTKTVRGLEAVVKLLRKEAGQ